MRGSVRGLTILLGLLSVLPGALRAQSPSVTPAPKVGDEAPDFTLPGSTREGVTAKPVHLKDLRGQTVVLAFFPRARTRGCTVQMTSYRNQYETLFNGGKGVALFSISSDKPEVQSAWAKDSGFVWRFLSDSGGSVGKVYSTWAGSYHNRTVYVIGADGRIAHVMKPFLETDPTAYTELKAAVDSARSGKRAP